MSVQASQVWTTLTFNTLVVFTSIHSGDGRLYDFKMDKLCLLTAYCTVLLAISHVVQDSSGILFSLLCYSVHAVKTSLTCRLSCWQTLHSSCNMKYEIIVFLGLRYLKVNPGGNAHLDILCTYQAN